MSTRGGACRVEQLPERAHVNSPHRTLPQFVQHATTARETRGATVLTSVPVTRAGLVTTAKSPRESWGGRRRRALVACDNLPATLLD